MEVKNLQIGTGNEYTKNENQRGLFGYIKNAIIKNVTINNLYVSGDTDVGGIAGVAENSTIENCIVNGRYSSYGIRGLESVGGIVGRMVDSHLIGCINRTHVYLCALEENGEQARHKVGGIVGYALLSDKAKSENDAILINDCYNKHVVYCKTTNNYQCTGGIIGRLVSESNDYRAVVKNCTNQYSVYSIESGTGGIVGYARNASIEKCNNYGGIEGTVAVGGIAGYAIHGTNIIDCDNSGNVVGFVKDDDDVDYTSCYVGGIAGSVYNARGTAFMENNDVACETNTYIPIPKDSLIQKCTNTGNVTCNMIYDEVEPQLVYASENPKEPSMIVVVGACTGGVAVDSVAFAEEGDSVYFDACTNEGIVTGSTYTGGLFGVAKNITTNGCSSTKTVTNADTDASDTIRDEIGLYANTVRFDACGGTVTPSLGLATYGKLESLPQPTYDRHVFKGWFTQKTGGTEVTTSTVFDSKTTLYAQWEPTYYTITYKPDEYTKEESEYTDKTDLGTSTYIKDDELYTRDGYVQVGWKTQDGMTTYSLGEEYTENTNITLYPVWEEIFEVRLPFTTKVSLGGNANPGNTVFKMEAVDEDIYKAIFPNLKCSGTVTTNGAGSYEGELVISGTYEEVWGFIVEGAYVRQTNEKLEGWTYSDTVWYVTLDRGAVDLRMLNDDYVDNDDELNDDGSEMLSLAVYPTVFEIDDGENKYYYVDWRNAQPVSKMTFENIYTAHAHEYTWKHDSTSHWQKCECGYIQGQQSHQYGDWTIVKKATQTVKGEKVHTCKVCGYSEKAEISFEDKHDETSGKNEDKNNKLTGPSKKNNDLTGTSKKNNKSTDVSDSNNLDKNNSDKNNSNYNDLDKNEKSDANLASPKTGNKHNILFLAAILLISGAGIVVSKNKGIHILR